MPAGSVSHDQRPLLARPPDRLHPAGARRVPPLTAHPTTDGHILITDLSGVFHIWAQGYDEYPILIDNRSDHDIMPGEILAVAKALLG